MKILIVEDEKNLATEICDYLANLSHNCHAAKDKFQALDELLISSYDLIVLDINLPDGSGLEVLQWLKTEKRQEHVIIVSARDAIDDKIKGLDLGADDYITKPFHLSELNSRINAVSRRKDANGNDEMTFNEITLNTRTRTVKVSGHDVEFTKTEYDLLRYFIVNKDTVLSKRAITSHVWRDEYVGDGAYDFIYVHIKNLRKKLAASAGKDYLKTIYGVGYRFQDV